MTDKKKYFDSLDALEKLMANSALLEGKKFGKSIKYELEINMTTETSPSLIYELTVTMKRNGYLFKTLTSFSRNEIDKSSAVREMIVIFNEISGLCFLDSGMFVIHEIESKLSASKILVNNPDKKMLLVAHSDENYATKELTIKYDDIIAHDSDKGESLTEFRGVYRIIKPKHPLLKK